MPDTPAIVRRNETLNAWVLTTTHRRPAADATHMNTLSEVSWNSYGTAADVALDAQEELAVLCQNVMQPGDELILTIDRSADVVVRRSVFTDEEPF